jgi:hypothetical protein
VALRVARARKVISMITSWARSGRAGSRNWGRKAMKKTRLLGLSAVTSQVWAKMRRLLTGTASGCRSAATGAARA